MSKRHSGPALLLDLPARRADVEALYRHRLVDRAGRDAALERLLPPRAWARWAAVTLATLGPALILAAVIYFFAYNWAAIGRFEKLGAAEGILACALLAAWHYGVDRRVGRVALTVAGVLVGAFLAVFGQIYQTGADAWQLFAVWSALIVWWCVIGRAAGLWVLWLTVTCIGLGAFLVQTGFLAERDEPFIYPMLTAVLLAFLAVREYLAGHGAQWVSGRWHRLLVSGAAIAIAAVPIWGTAVHLHRMNSAMLWAAGIGLVVHAAFIDVYRHRCPDIWPVAVAVLSLCLCAVVWAHEWLDRHLGDAALYFALAGFTLMVFGAAVAWLRNAGTPGATSHE